MRHLPSPQPERLGILMRGAIPKATCRRSAGIRQDREAPDAVLRSRRTGAVGEELIRIRPERFQREPAAGDQFLVGVFLRGATDAGGPEINVAVEAGIVEGEFFDVPVREGDLGKAALSAGRRPSPVARKTASILKWYLPTGFWATAL